MRCYSVYILASKRNGTLYTGVTNDLARRVYEHKEKKVHGFTELYNVNKLVYAEDFDTISDAIGREKAIKKWSRKQKLDIIERHNPNWDDLYENLN